MSVYSLDDIKAKAKAAGENWLNYIVDEGDDALDAICIRILPSGSGFDSVWNWYMQKNGKVVFSSSFHYMNPLGYYDGWYNLSVTLELDHPMDFRLRFHNPPSWRVASDLRDYLEDAIAFSLERLEWEPGQAIRYRQYHGSKKAEGWELLPGFILAIKPETMTAIIGRSTLGPSIACTPLDCLLENYES